MPVRTRERPRRWNHDRMPAGPSRASGHRFRPRSAIVVAVCWGLVTLAWAWFAVHDGGAIGLVRQLPGVALAAVLGYGVLLRPSVEVSPTGVVLRNVVRDVEVPWAALADVRTRFALTLVTTDGRHFAAWAAPAAGRHTDSALTVREVRALGLRPGDGGGGGEGEDGCDGPDLPTASASTASHSGAVAAWIRREWQRSVEDDAAADAAGAGARLRVAASTTPVARTRLARGVLGTAGVAGALVVVTALR